MLGFVVITSMIIFALIIPLIVLVKYYSPKQLSLLANIFWIIVAIFTWPLVPIVMALRRHDKILLSCFWISFLVFAVSIWYWGVLNIAKIIQFQEMLKVSGS